MTLRLRRFVPLIASLAIGASVFWSASALTSDENGGEVGSADPFGTVLRVEIKGAIGPATSNYVVKGIARAEEDNARLVLIEMDTPGGLDSAMRDIIKAILSSSVPVATYVSPSGSRAASAGTYILYASHVAAMAPATNLGAATPVQIGGEDTPQQAADSDTDTKDEEGDAKPAPAGNSAMKAKAINDAVAYIRGLAELRGRNADWAEKAVREAASMSAEKALENNIIDLIAKSVPELLEQIDGRIVKIGDSEVELATAGLVVVPFEPDWRTKLLAVITDPNIAYMLMLAGIYGLLFEGYNPGAIVPGVVGAICLLLALFAFQVLPVNYAGLALILLGVMLIVAEAFVPSFGALGLGGIAAFVFGSIILLDTEVPGMTIARSVIVAVAVPAAGVLLAMVYILMKIRRRPTVSGVESMLGKIAEVIEDFDRSGTVFINGERWNAKTAGAVRRGDKVRVSRVDGLVLEIAPLEP